MNLAGLRSLSGNISELLKRYKTESARLVGYTFGKNKNDNGLIINNSNDAGAIEAVTNRFVEAQNTNKSVATAPVKLYLPQTQSSQTYAPKAVILPLKAGQKNAGYEELSRHVVQATLEQNGIQPSNLEMEEIMALPQNQQIDMNEAFGKNWKPIHVPGLMPSPANYKDISGREVFGYKMTLSPQWQAGIISDYKQVRGELSKPENANRKAVVDMTMSERYNEMLRVVWDKGYISEELKKQYHTSTLTEFIAAFGIGGAVGLLAGTAAGGAIAPVSGFILAVYAAKKMTEISVISHDCRMATNRQGFDKPAREFAQLLGAMAKDTALAATGAIGGFAAPRVMPPLTQATENLIVEAFNGGKQITKSIPQLGEPVPAAPDSTPIKTPKGKTAIGDNEPLKIVTVDEQGRPSGTRFRDDYESHIKEREFTKASQKGGVNGAHNLDELEKYAVKVGEIQTKESINIISKTPHPTVKGIYKVEYQMPKLDTRGQPAGLWRNKSGTKLFEKTVYDSKIISDSQMAQWGREAFADAVQTNNINLTSRRWEGTAANGLKFEGYVDSQNSAVRTFYPKF